MSEAYIVQQACFRALWRIAISWAVPFSAHRLTRRKPVMIVSDGEKNYRSSVNCIRVPFFSIEMNCAAGRSAARLSWVSPDPVSAPVLGIVFGWRLSAPDLPENVREIYRLIAERLCNCPEE
jgi:hypothetical protein